MKKKGMLGMIMVPRVCRSVALEWKDEPLHKVLIDRAMWRDPCAIADLARP